MPSTNYYKFNHLLTDPEEKILNTLGNSAAEVYADTGKIKKGFAVLTNQRVHFRGKCHIRLGHGKSHKLKSYSVDLQDITATAVVSTCSLPFRILAKVVTIFAVIANGWEIYRLLAGTFQEQMILNIVIPWLLALVFTLLDQMLTYRLFKVSFADGSLALDVRWISHEEAKVFQHSLQQACNLSITE